MALEDVIVKLTAALEANTAALMSATAVKSVEPVRLHVEPKAPKAAQAKPAEAAPKAKKPTLEDIRLHLNNYAKVHGKPAALSVLKDEFGADSPADLDPERYQALIDHVKPADAGAF